MDSYIYLITALLPLAAAMLVFQTNPYHALVIRGILGAIAALVYAVLGAADVALTEALVGTLLAVTLYAVAVRSSLVLRLGVLQADMIQNQNLTEPTGVSPLQQWVDRLKQVFRPWSLRIELVPYDDRGTLHQALLSKEVHAISLRSEAQSAGESLEEDYHTITRVHRLYEIMHRDLSAASAVQVTYLNPDRLGDGNADVKTDVNVFTN